VANVVLGARSMYVTTTDSSLAATHAASWLHAVEPGRRVVRGLMTAQHRAARATLGDPAERTLHGVETAGWGTSGWDLRWGSFAADDEQHVSAALRVLLANGARGARPVKSVPDDAFVLTQVPPAGWAPRVICEQTRSGRVLVGVGACVRGERAAERAAVAAQYLGTPLHGRLFVGLRQTAPVAYGLMAMPVVRGDRVALVAGVSTRPQHAVQCIRLLAAELQDLVTYGCAPDDAAAFLHRLDLAWVKAASVARSGWPVDPVARCLLELGPWGDADGPARDERAELCSAPLPVPDRPAWFASGALPDGLATVAEEVW
jgi:hypothetical protein